MAILKPAPSPPITFPAGTLTSCMITSAVLESRMPILSSCFPTVSPSESRSTMNIVRPLAPLPASVTASTV